MTIKLREPVSGLTHLAGTFLSIAGLVLLIYKAITSGTVWHIVSFVIFGVSLVLLYASSSLYHLLPLPEKGVRALKRLDHMMIYVLIAGSYTPMCLVALRGPWGWGLLSAVGIATLGGILLKVFWLNAPRWLSTLLYVMMGWGVAIAIVPLARALPVNGLVWLLTGGLLYSLGAIIYGTKWPSFSPKFGFHELWHLFVMAGSFSHFWMVFKYIGAMR